MVSGPLFFSGRGSVGKRRDKSFLKTKLTKLNASNMLTNVQLPNQEMTRSATPTLALTNVAPRNYSEGSDSVECWF